MGGRFSGRKKKLKPSYLRTKLDEGEANGMEKIKKPPIPSVCSAYKPNYCDVIIDVGRKGMDFKCFCATVGVPYKTASGWVDRYPQFKEAKAVAEHLSYMWWFRLIQGLGAGKVKGSAAAAMFAMRNIGGWDTKIGPGEGVGENNDFQVIMTDYRGKQGKLPPAVESRLSEVKALPEPETNLDEHEGMTKTEHVE